MANSVKAELYDQLHGLIDRAIRIRQTGLGDPSARDRADQVKNQAEQLLKRISATWESSIAEARQSRGEAAALSTAQTWHQKAKQWVNQVNARIAKLRREHTYVVSHRRQLGYGQAAIKAQDLLFKRIDIEKYEKSLADEMLARATASLRVAKLRAESQRAIEQGSQAVQNRIQELQNQLLEWQLKKSELERREAKMAARNPLATYSIWWNEIKPAKEEATAYINDIQAEIARLQSVPKEVVREGPPPGEPEIPESPPPTDITSIIERIPIADIERIPIAETPKPTMPRYGWLVLGGVGLVGGATLLWYSRKR